LKGAFFLLREGDLFMNGDDIKQKVEEKETLESSFQRYHTLLFAIAYRMLGSASEAEDMLQESYIRYMQATQDKQANPQEIRSVKAYLTTIVTRLCLDYLKSARMQREQYIGPWLPEPILTADPEAMALQTLEQRESVGLAFLRLLERLTPYERSVLLLHDVFAYRHEEIAEIIGKSAAHCRLLLRQAKEHLQEQRARFTPSADVQQRLVERFVDACQVGNVEGLVDLLAQEVAKWADGGGKVGAARRPVYGREKVLRLLSGLMRLYYPHFHFSVAEINGTVGVLMWHGDSLVGVTVFEIRDEQIYEMYDVLNPDKLAYIRRQLQGKTGI
jgi:RNA polymerase sigma-70 factor, ECF subfamily